MTKITRRQFIRSGLVVSGASLGALAWAREVEPEWVEVENLEIPLSRLPRAFDGFKIAQISDVHIEEGGIHERFSQICDLVSRQKADAILVTGDFVSRPAPWNQKALETGLARLHAPQGTFAVMGNHDHWGDVHAVRRTLRASGVRELRNQIHSFERENSRLHLAGLDDFLAHKADWKSVARQIPGGEATILLAHEPDLADQTAALGCFDLQLSGHSHGGQVCLPFVGALHTPFGAKKYRSGLFQIEKMALYVNRGLGTTGIPVRFLCRPEITVFTLRAA